MRHGPAEDESASGRDFDRALTHAGRERTRRVARELARNDEGPRHIMTSPLVRAVETATIVREALDLDEPLIVRRELAPGGGATQLVREVVEGNTGRVMLVGHEPSISALAALLLGQWDEGFDKSMVVGVRLDRASSKAELRFVLEPKQLVWRTGPAHLA